MVRRNRLEAECLDVSLYTGAGQKSFDSNQLQPIPNQEGAKPLQLNC